MRFWLCIIGLIYVFSVIGFKIRRYSDSSKRFQILENIAKGGTCLIVIIGCLTSLVMSVSAGWLAWSEGFSLVNTPAYGLFHRAGMIAYGFGIIIFGLAITWIPLIAIGCWIIGDEKPKRPDEEEEEEVDAKEVLKAVNDMVERVQRSKQADKFTATKNK